MNIYNLTSKVRELHTVLQDGLSRQVFWARLQTDVDESMQNILKLVSLCGNMTEKEAENWKCEIQRFERLARLL